MEYETFDDWASAYQACRKRNRAIVVKVGTETARICPNGEYQLLHSEQPEWEAPGSSGSPPETADEYEQGPGRLREKWVE
jgi:hypothetical protein